MIPVMGGIHTSPCSEPSGAVNWQMIALTTFTCLKLPLSPWSCDKVNSGQGLM